MTPRTAGIRGAGGHNAIAGDFVTFSSAGSLGGAITAPILNQEYEIQSILTASTYTIKAPVAANASDIGNGGASTVGTYQINIGTDISVSLTGAAGPDAHGEQPAGTVWIGIADENGAKAYRLQLSGMRNSNRLRAVKLALYYVIRTLAAGDARKI